MLLIVPVATAACLHDDFIIYNFRRIFLLPPLRARIPRGGRSSPRPAGPGPSPAAVATVRSGRAVSFLRTTVYYSGFSIESEAACKRMTSRPVAGHLQRRLDVEERRLVLRLVRVLRQPSVEPDLPCPGRTPPKRRVTSPSHPNKNSKE